jgi:hypothetical protein
MGIGLASRGPDIADDQAGGAAVRRAGGKERTALADSRIALVVAIAVAIGGDVSKQLALRAAVAVPFCLIGVLIPLDVAHLPE